MLFLSDNQNCFQQHDVAAIFFWETRSGIFLERTVRSRGSWQPVEPASCAIPCSVVRSLETAETIADCCIFEPAKTLVGTELAGGMQIFDATVKERI